MRIRRGLFGFLSLFISMGFITLYAPEPADGVLPIGQIQGREMVSPYLDQKVTFRGIVTGAMEDQNTRGRRYYTIFAQDLVGFEDGDPLSSDGMAIFLGSNKPLVATGDIVYVTGKVTEYYGLTEIDDDGLWLTIESRNNPLPLPVELDPPAGMREAEDYYERLEGMLVSVPKAVTVGPTHVGCGLAVVREEANQERVFRREISDPAGQIINVLNASDVDCTGLPALAVGNLVEGLKGPLTYHFDRYKLIQQNPGELSFNKRGNEIFFSDLPLTSSQVSLATFNLDNYFDDVDDTGDIAEPKFSEVELDRKIEKLAATISDVLMCPTIIGVQEVEKESLLIELSQRLLPECGFPYTVSHLDAPDSRGSDLALLSDPRKVTVRRVSQYQACSFIETGVTDLTVNCPKGEEPLFSRPPLLVKLDFEGQTLSIFVNHFKSKRGGETETAPRRLAQAQHLLGLVSDSLTVDKNAAIVVLGDFNDYDQSPLMETFLDSGLLLDGLELLPAGERYSYIFDGASQLVDWILVAPCLKERIVMAQIIHVNADYPYQLGRSLEGDEIYLRSSDHDIPLLVVDLAEDFESEMENPAIEGSDAKISEDMPATAEPPKPKEMDPEPTRMITNKDIVEDIDRTPDLPSKDDESAYYENNEIGRGEGNGNRFRLEWSLALAGAILIVAAFLLSLRKRHKEH